MRRRQSRQALFLAVALAGLAVGGWLLQWSIATRNAAHRTLEVRLAERAALAGRSPAPSEENAAAMERELALAQSALNAMRTRMGAQTGGEEKPPPTALEIHFAVAGFAARVQALAARERVKLKPGESFSFSVGAGNGPEPALGPIVGRQLKAGEWLLETLALAHPEALLRVQREHPADLRRRTAVPDGSQPADRHADAGAGEEPAGEFISRQSWTRDTVPNPRGGGVFALEFTGTTRTLRSFLNRLAGSGQPLAIHQVEVETVDAMADSPALRPAPARAGSREPVKFTVVVEMFGLGAAAKESVP